MCRVYGYHRTSTKDQHLDRGIKEIKEYCKLNNLELEYIYKDQQTGKNFNRPQYNMLKEQITDRAKEGKETIIIITEIDRLGRNKEDTLKELRYFKDNNIRIMILELPTTLINLDKFDNVMSKMMLETINNMLIEMYASLAHAEMLKREKRQKEGIKAMKDRGDFDKYGRPGIKIDKNFIEIYNIWKEGKIKAVEAFKKLNMSKPTFYRKVKEYELNSNKN